MRRARDVRRYVRVVVALVSCGCGGGLETPTAPPPEGTPWLATRFEATLTPAVTEFPGAASACSALGLGALPSAVGVELTQDAESITLSLVPLEGGEARPIVLRGCVTSDGEGRFRVRVGGLTRATVEEGASRCVARVALPPERLDAVAQARGDAEYRAAETLFIESACVDRDDPRFPTVELDVCADGALRGQLSWLVDWQGEACGGLTRCSVAVELEANPTARSETEPQGALRGGECGP